MDRIDYTPFYHLKINNISSRSALKYCEAFFDSPGNNSVYFINAHCFNISLKNQLYVEALQSGDLLLNDGIGVKIGAKMIGVEIQENLNGTDLIPKIISLACQKKEKIFLLGSKSGIAERAKKNLEKRYDGIQITGVASGYFNDDSLILEQINKSNASILIVGMGVPRQEIWIHKYKDDLSNVKLTIAGGAILDFISGNVHRAPLFIQKISLEWLFRFFQEPIRLFKRYFFGNISFLWFVFKNRRKYIVNSSSN